MSFFGVRAEPDDARSAGAAVATFVLAPELPVFEGHFPGFAIVPGVFLLDAALRTIPGRRSPTSPLRRVQTLRLLAPVWPGDRLTCEAKCEGRAGDEETWAVRCRVGERAVADVRVVLEESA